MHQRLSDILGEEVMGQITRVGDTRSFHDVGIGRVCLEQLSRSRIEELVARLQEALGPVEHRDRLHLDDASAPVRGLVELTVPDEVLGSRYLLQISSELVYRFYERRFLLEPGVPGDVMGVLCDGLQPLFAQGREAPLRQITGYEELERDYREQLDQVIQAAAAGRNSELSDFPRLAAGARACWRMLPWALRCQLQPASDAAGQRLASLDQTSNRTILFTTNVIEGEMVHEYTHQHQELEQREEVLGWLSEVHQVLIENYLPPMFEIALAHASSVARFVACFPRFQQMLELEPERTRPMNADAQDR